MNKAPLNETPLNETLLNEGKPLQDALQLLREKDPNASIIQVIGINCCDSAHIAPLLEIIVQDMALQYPVTTTPRTIAVYPNSGEEWDAAHGTWKEGTGCTDSNQFAERMMEAVALVESTWKQHAPGRPMPKLLLGGCCRTSPRTIQKLRQLVDERERRLAK